MQSLKHFQENLFRPKMHNNADRKAFLARRIAGVPASVRGSTRLWRLASLGFLALTLTYGAIHGGHFQRQMQNLADFSDHIVRYVGFGIEDVTVSGLNRVTSDEVTSSISLDSPQSIIRFDTQAAQARLEALPWVRKARVMRLLPSTLNIDIEEREPFAYWQNKGIHYLIDTDGATILKARPGEYGSLPLIVGKGAPKGAGYVQSLLMQYPSLAVRVKALVRVADRRWTLLLKSGPDILLPEKNISQALTKLAEMERSKKLLQQPLRAVDLRIPGRVTLRLKKDASPKHNSSSQDEAQPLTHPERDA